MGRDMEREAAALGLACSRPDPFPQNSLIAARVALLGADEGWTPPSRKAVYRGRVRRGPTSPSRPIARPILDRLGLDRRAISKAASSEAEQDRLEAIGEEAHSRGIFGAPTFLTEAASCSGATTASEQALAWATGASAQRAD